MERNLHDSMYVVRNVLLEPRMMPGGGAAEMALAKMLTENASKVTGMRHWPYAAIARALEVIPRTLIQNCGGNTIRQLTALRVSHLFGIFETSSMCTSGKACGGRRQLDMGCRRHQRSTGRHEAAGRVGSTSCQAASVQDSDRGKKMDTSFLVQLLLRADCRTAATHR